MSKNLGNSLKTCFSIIFMFRGICANLRFRIDTKYLHEIIKNKSITFYL